MSREKSTEAEIMNLLFKLQKINKDTLLIVLLLF